MKKRMSEKELKKIHEFLEYAKASIKESIVLEQEFNGFRVAYDGYWTRYSVVNDDFRCQLPEDSLEIDRLPECARHCWKLLIFTRKPEDTEASVKLLLPFLKSGEVKCFKHNGNVDNRKTLTPVNDAPFVIVIYTWGIEERDRLKAKLHAIGFTNIPYRRGCKMFERRFGHWKQWFKE